MPKKTGDKSDEVWDYIIIGAGISGLYTAYRLRQHAEPSARILILEAGCRVGGRMGLVDFHGVKVEPGAGIGRLEKDHALSGLLEELGIKWQEFPVTHNYSPAVYNSLLSNAAKKHKIGRIGRIAQKVEVPPATSKLSTPDWIKKQVGKLRAAYKKTPATTTFHAFAQKVLGRTGYQQLILALGYTDFEKEDVAETLYNYGLDDLYAHWTGMGIDWQELMDSLVEHSFADIRLNTRAVRITHTKTPQGSSFKNNNTDGFFTIQTSHVPSNDLTNNINSGRTHKSNARLHNSAKSKNTIKHNRFGLTRQNIPNLVTSNSIGCNKNNSTERRNIKNHLSEFRARKVLIATSIGPAKELVNDFLTGQGLRVPVHLSGVHAQSFLRIYGYFTGENQTTMAKYVQHTQVVPGGYHRIIPMGTSDDGKSGVYMIVYTDNRAADDLEHLCANTMTNRQILATGLKAALGIPIDTHLEIDDILGYYWREGTHYYSPLNHAKFGSRDDFLRVLQRPVGNKGGLFLAGEAFSRQQGWTEGAIESVDNILSDMI